MMMLLYLPRIRLSDQFRFRFISETMNSIRCLGMTAWMRNLPLARPLPAEDNTTKKDAGIQPCLERDNHDPSVRAIPDNKRLRPRAHWDWNIIVLG
jgi:hypothetical protein